MSPISPCFQFVDAHTETTKCHLLILADLGGYTADMEMNMSHCITYVTPTSHRWQ